MRRFAASLAFTLLLAGCDEAPTATPKPAAAEEPATTLGQPSDITLKAADGARVFARYYPAEHPKALLLLFHQAGSSKDEYAPIAPSLVADGYSALAVDARAGGDLFGPNQTVKALGRAADYVAARQDLQAAIDWAQDKKLPIFLWGSSYSSALVFPLAAANKGKIAGVLAFSPNEYLGDGDPVKTAAGQIDVPVFITAANDAEELDGAQAIASRMAADHTTFYKPEAGVHGASTLREDRNPKGWRANFSAVEAWLKKAVS
ncbi:MAG: lysophospholipase [Sphingomonas sp.]|uniref:alpha/beta hydrolase n=1 Tax=Sphingomonas sp. TaxID=28214 RepID=UPI0025DB7DB6|nr:alpha/beta hydrolase [Sphingomonas sp.]MBX9882626.1 lysophospholipase [Sphingomonas sp.]